MLLAPTGKVGGLEYQFNPGDLFNTNEAPITIALDAIYTYTGPDLAQGEIFRTLMTAGRADVFCTAQQLIDALRGSINQVTPPANELYGIQPSRSVQLAWPANLMPFAPGSSFRRIISATTAFALAMAVQANSGLTFAAAPYNVTTVAASSWREFIFQILNSSPTVVIAMNQVNATKPLSIPSGQSVDLVNNVTAGMSAFGTNVAAGSKVAAVNRDTGVITLDTNVTASLNNNPITFTPTVVVYGLRSGTL